MSVSFTAKVGEKNYSMTALLTSLIGESKLQLENIIGELNCSERMRFIYKGRILNDTMVIQDAGIAEGDCVVVMISKAATTLNNPTPSSTVPQSSGSSPVIPATSAVDAAMIILLNNTQEVVETAINTMLKVTSNIINHPIEDKYRKVPTSNATFNSKLGSVPGGRELMAAIGFDQFADSWQLVPNARKWDVLNACHNKLTIFAAKLKAAAADNGSGAAAPPAVSLADPSSQPSIPQAPSALVGHDELVAIIASLAASSMRSTSAPQGPEGNSEDSARGEADPSTESEK